MSARCFYHHHAQKTRGVLWRNGARKKQPSFWVKKTEISLKKTLVVVIGTNVGVVSPWVIIFNPNDI
jgi:hypothetical protein